MINSKPVFRQYLASILKLVVALSLLLWLIQSGRFDLDQLKSLKSLWVWVVGVLLFFGVVVINSKRWQILLNLEKVSISYTQALRLSLIGVFFNFFVPGGGVGGDVVKAGYLIKAHRAKGYFIGWSVLVDRVFGVLALLFFSALTGLLFYPQLAVDLQFGFFSLSLSIFIGFFIFTALLLFSPRSKIKSILCSHSFLEKTLLPLFFFFRRPGFMILPFVLSLVSQALVMGVGLSLFFLLDPGFPLWMIFLVFPFGFLATVLPISPAGLGVGQAAFYYLFDKVAGHGEFGVLTVTFFQAVQFAVGLLGGLLFVVYKQKDGSTN